jgi:NAD(P)-dependent dehydrogenase (short-subunit alcohol dehydrogenase family)
VVSARDSARVETVVQSIRAAGGRAEGAVVDATDDAAVGAHLDRLVKQHGRLDAVFNGIGGTPADLKYPASSRTQTLADFLVPLDRIVGSQFLTARHAARVMAPRQRGAIVLLSATLSGMPATHMAGISAACGAIEALGRALAGEFGPEGIRVNCVRGSAMPETRTIQLTGAGLAPLGLTPQMVPPPMRRPITVDETAKVAAFLASDASSGMTGQVVTVCGGAFV